MDAQSPPKRMTRARASAKTSEPAAKSSRAATAATRAKAVRSTAATTRTSTATKRKSPCDEEEQDHELAPARKMPATGTKVTRGRGRPKKEIVEEPAPAPEPEPAPAAANRTRGRPKKRTAEPVVDEPVKASRTARTKKTVSEETEAVVEPATKKTRGRPALSTSTTTSASRSLAKPAVKKTVKFEEPEKENVAPATKPGNKASAKTSAATPATGLRGKPVRKAASAASTRTARSTRAAASTAAPSEKEEKPMPLSPKKINQLTMNARVESDDELGMEEKAPVRRLKKAPIKHAVGDAKSSKAPSAVADKENEESAATVGRPEMAVNVMLATPAKRLPASPWKGSIKSPAKRVDGLLFASIAETEAQSSEVSTKKGLLASPAKRQPLNLNPSAADSITGTGFSPVKLSFLSSPAKRPISPIKPLPRTVEEEAPQQQTPAPKPTLLASPLSREESCGAVQAKEPVDMGGADAHNDGGAIPDSPRLSFPGRLSDVLPRHADPTLTPTTMAGADETNEAQDALADLNDEHDDREILEEVIVLGDQPVDAPAVESASTTPPPSPPKTANPMFELREKDLTFHDHGAESESDDESPARPVKFTSAFSTLPATPNAASAGTPNTMRSTRRRTLQKLNSESKFGFTPLAEQLSGWTAGPSPLKNALHVASPTTTPTVTAGEEQTPIVKHQPAATPEPPQNTFFEDQMHAAIDAMEVEEEASTDLEDNDSPILEDVPFTEEDLALAAEAQEMSLMEREHEDSWTQGQDDTLSEPSQEYGDENAMPVEPALPGGHVARASAVPPVTPQRAIHREFHTVAKVPVKPADESTPRPRIETRSYSASKLSAKKPTEQLTRNATVISYSPSKGADADSVEEQPEERAGSVPPETPQKSDIWSTIGTPARTPRRDLNPALLRGAVVFVDVHTSEGADASGIFVELLTQMGARCVKTWSWNPNHSSEQGGDLRVGITHVVYKDGGKRTLEKVRESGGLVQCVGVSWVLDCERENQWLDEAPYYIDTAVVPRGGARRRKSMEPRAIANLNGMLVPSPVGNSSRGCKTAPSTPNNSRRASALWIRSPEKSNEEDAEHDALHNDDSDADGLADLDWQAPLTPVPKTPAPEAIARYVANISPGSATPSSVASDDSDDPLTREDDAHRREETLLRTCPPKRTAFVELGEGILSKEKDERVLMRLMAARRKSLQFAPKVGSPLAKTWKALN
ncbi:uncharacterized protein B0T15DRAFT_516239 [Chaetomium strumarium]|uniref:BRCT domain-containing protein n=1 Tax=Chaetomium strumarium TaxID=1170767 RepID=A0AAJ0H0R8_9PEZI|nr:hypothetical protein B0T15DRAFT_516239 [Chaetomium strumarium]